MLASEYQTISNHTILLPELSSPAYSAIIYNHPLYIQFVFKTRLMQQNLRNNNNNKDVVYNAKRKIGTGTKLHSTYLMYRT